MAAQNIPNRAIYPPAELYVQQVPRPRPVRVDPFAPLPTSFEPVHNADNPAWPEEVQRNSIASPEQPKDDLARTASRKRRVSGTGRGPRRAQLESYPQPAAPEVSATPTAPYQNGKAPSVNNPMSFAARARVLPDEDHENPPLADLVAEPEPAYSEKPKRKESTRRHRRPTRQDQSELDGQENSGEAAKQNGAPIQQIKVADVATTAHYMNPTTGRQQEAPSSSEPIPVTSPPARSNTRKSSTGQADPRREWAPDRSPLQKLEVKLNDISKEEKRARMEKAEQRLRESKAYKERHGPGQEVQSSDAHRPTKVSAVRNQDEPPPAQALQGSHRRRDKGNNQRSVVPAYSEDLTRQQPEQNQTSSHDRQPQVPTASASEKTRSTALEQQPLPKTQASDAPDDVEGRGVRFHAQEDKNRLSSNPVSQSSQHFGQDRSPSGTSSQSAGPQQRLRDGQLAMGARTSKEVPTQQQALYSNKTRRSGENDDAAAFGGAPDPVSTSAVRSQNKTIKYDIPPQTAAGIEARQKVGFGGDLDGPVEAPAHHKHRLSEILHHGRKSAPGSGPQLESQPRHLDEWRQGGVARLTADDLVTSMDDTKGQNAWWERGNSSVNKTSDATKPQRNPGVKSVSYAEDYGQDTRSFDPPLFLKCGPLLRYTGLKRDKLQHSLSRSNTSNRDRESWRGSVMIVTLDHESDYSTIPTLRLFPEPIELLPPPPLQVDGESGHSLPSEYIDPIAGLPKLSRIGTTVYVKPVEDLEPGVDLSRVETDDGLFEETRTAAVPTSYGKPNPRLSQSRQSESRTKRIMGNTISKSQSVRGVRLHAERGVTFWRFNMEVELSSQQTRIAYSINNGPSIGFWVPAKGQSMNIMFHSCNGFSMSVK